MDGYRLTTRAPGDHASATTFYWERAGKSSSFISSFGPQLGHLGRVAALNADLVRIAVAVRATDASVGRGIRWRVRDLRVSVPVSDPAAWTARGQLMNELLGLLTGDMWRVTYRSESFPEESLKMNFPGTSRVVLLSGGADSGAGALLSALSMNDTQKQTLVSHYSTGHISPIQHALAQHIEAAAPATTLEHLQLNHVRLKRSPGGDLYGKESSSRSRSLLFIALGLAAASVEKVPLLIPENGFASINPPLGYDRRGSLSTKTTHPLFFNKLKALLVEVGAHADFSNPYALNTKGEMFVMVRGVLGKKAASEYLSATNSCGHSGARSYGIYPTVQCGVCFGCVLRKASFKAAGLVDGSKYVDPSQDPRIPAWLESKSVLGALEAFIQTPPTQLTLATLRLPAEYGLDQAHDLCRRAVAELQGYLA
jgi:7-cyano-7-deazaguanine synthase in queuosine biosynthesis